VQYRPSADSGPPKFGEPDHVERLHRLGAPRVLANALHLQTERDVVEHAPVREQGEVLEDRGRRALVRRQVDERLAVEHDVALARELVAPDHAQRRRLAAAGRPEQDDVLPVVDMQVDVVDRDGAAGEDLREPDQIEP